MGLFNFFTNRRLLREILFQLQLNNEKSKKMATSIKDLEAKVDQLQTSIDNEQAQVATVITGLKEANTSLQAIIDAGGVVTPEQLDALATKLDTAITDLQSTIPDTEEA